MVENLKLRLLVGLSSVLLPAMSDLFDTTDEADTSSTHEFYKSLPDVDLEKDEEVQVDQTCS